MAKTMIVAGCIVKGNGGEVTVIDSGGPVILVRTKRGDTERLSRQVSDRKPWAKSPLLTALGLHWVLTNE